MDYLGNFYKNKAEQLLEQIKVLEEQLQNLQEKSATPTLLQRDPRVPSVAGVDDYNPGPPSAVRYSAENNPAPNLLTKDPMVPTPPAKGQPAPVEGGSKPASQPQASLSGLFDGDDMLSSGLRGARNAALGQQLPAKPTQDDVMKALTMNLNRLSSAWAKKGTQSAAAQGNNSDGYDITARIGQSPDQIAAMNTPSMGGQSGRFGGDGQMKAAMQSVINSVSGTNQSSSSQTTPSTSGGQPTTSSFASTATTSSAGQQTSPGFVDQEANRPRVQATSNPKVSTYDPYGWIKQQKAEAPGRIQIHGGDSEWARKQLEQEVGISSTPGAAGRELRAKKAAENPISKIGTGYEKGSAEDLLVRIFGRS